MSKPKPRTKTVIVKDEKGRKVFEKVIEFDGEEKLIREIFESLSKRMRKRFEVSVE